MRIIYENYYFFFQKILKDPDPHLATCILLGFNQSIIINSIVSLIIIKVYCYQVPTILQFIFSIFLIYLNYKKNQSHIEDVKSDGHSRAIKPLNSIGIICALAFFLFAISWLY